MADGKVTISVDLDGKQAQGGIEKLKVALGGLGSTFKSMLGANLISGALMGGFNALAGSVKGVFSSAIDEGAKLQQSIGGIETLFKESADTVKNYASQSFRTAGLSANEYMENVTSFSASLISSLGGDTAAAAELANRAMTDMSDNANKMGTDMKAISGTYQSLARGNFAMLDNLKLGYGGTKAEMQRLIKDAASYKDIQEELNLTVDESDLSFANMVKAISVVQKKLDITGTTAKEAATTFSGSFASMKAAFQDFLGNLTTGGDITKPLQALAETASTFFFGNFIPMIGNIFKGLPTALSSFIEAAKPALVNGLKELLPEEAISGITKVFDLITYSIDDMVTAFQDFYQGFEKTGAIKALSSALLEFLTAGLDLSEKLSGIIPWETIGAAAGHVVKFIAQIIQAVAKFSQSISGDTWRGVVTGIGGALVAFKAFNFLKSFNPFSFFKKGAEEATEGVTGGVKRAKSTISQVFSGISNIIKTAGNALKSTFQGLGNMFKGLGKSLEGFGKGLGAALKGLMQGLKGLNPATLLSFGAAVGIAAVGIGAGIAIIAAGFTLLASKSEGVATIINAVGEAFATVATAIIGGFADAIVEVSSVLPIVTESLAKLSPLIVAVGEAIGACAPAIEALGNAWASILEKMPAVITAFGSAISQIIEAVTPIVEIVGNTFTQLAQIVADCIVRCVEALAPFIPSITEMVIALAPVLQSIVEAFNNLISQIKPVIDSITNLFKTLGEQISNILDSAKGVIEGFGGAVRNILDGIAGIFESMGNAAKNAGQGVKLMAQGIKMLVDLKLGDLVATLGAVATGLTAIANSGIASAGPGLQQAGIGLQLIATSAQLASVAMQSLPQSFNSLSSAIGALPADMSVASSAMIGFAKGAVVALSGLNSAVGQISAFTASLSTLNSSISTSSAIVSTRMLLIVSSISRSMSQAQVVIQRACQEFVTAFRNATPQAVSAMTAMMNGIRSAGMSGVGSMRYVGAMIGQGLAQGMYSALGSVTAAANALVAQAERAAQAKAKIHSPSRLFRDNVGRFISQGVAVGIIKDAYKVDDAMGDVYRQIQSFSYKAEDIIGIGKSKLSKAVQVKQELEQAVKASVEVAKEKSNDLLEKALDVAEKAVQRPAEMVLDDGTLVAKTGDKFASYQSEQIRRTNRMRGKRT
ncbi:hypothetical protein [Streptococcus azizii]|uniref:PblA n=1 Tax=Streptococcus azizii TaxID=1579424 RepID=A0AB36JM92_9STRE|nr:hypothetical protein [Streptococcus azizii]ONK25748.1 hypothetical protein BVE86_09580 [Streptococcus azizii]